MLSLMTLVIMLSHIVIQVCGYDVHMRHVRLGPGGQRVASVSCSLRLALASGVILHNLVSIARGEGL